MLKKLLYLNGLAILAVVLNHARVWGVITMVFWTDRYRLVTVPNYDQVGSLEYYGLAVIAGLIQFAIPTFLFVSGFYIAIATGKSRPTIPWNAVLTRIKFLVIPYFVWVIIMSGVLFLDGHRYTLIEYLKLILTGYIQGPYYFVPMLVQLYLLAPFMVPLAKSNWKLLLIGAALIQLLTQVLLYFELFQVNTPFPQFHVLPIWFSFTRMFWFVLGIIVGLHLHVFKEWLDKVKWSFVVLIIIFLVFTTFERDFVSRADITIPVETTIGSIYALSFIFTVLAFANIQLPLANRLEKVGGKSFGIYLTHSPAQEYTSRIIYHIAPWLLEYQIVFVTIIFIIGLGGPLLLMEIVKRSPIGRYYQYIFG